MESQAEMENREQEKVGFTAIIYKEKKVSNVNVIPCQKFKKSKEPLPTRNHTFLKGFRKLPSSSVSGIQQT